MRPLPVPFTFFTLRAVKPCKRILIHVLTLHTTLKKLYHANNQRNVFLHIFTRISVFFFDICLPHPQSKRNKAFINKSTLTMPWCNDFWLFRHPLIYPQWKRKKTKVNKNTSSEALYLPAVDNIKSETYQLYINSNSCKTLRIIKSNIYLLDQRAL